MNRKQKLFLAIVLASTFSVSAHAEISQRDQLKAAQRAFEAQAESENENVQDAEAAKKAAERTLKAAEAAAAAVVCSAGNAAACAAAAAAATAASN